MNLDPASCMYLSAWFESTYSGVKMDGDEAIVPSGCYFDNWTNQVYNNLDIHDSIHNDNSFFNNGLCFQYIEEELPTYELIVTTSNI